MPISFSLRAATRDDVPHLREMLIETWHDAYDGILGKEAVAQRCSSYFHPAVMYRYLGSDRWTPVAVSPDGKIAGFMSTRCSPLGGVTIEMLYVAPRYQRHGLGLGLISSIAAQYPAVRWNTLDVLEPNLAARRFYEKLGFSAWYRRMVPEGVPILVMTRKVQTAATWLDSLRAFIWQPPQQSLVFRLVQAEAGSTCIISREPIT